MSKMIDETGKNYGYLTVIKRVKNNSQGQAMWLCQCKCGNIVTVSGTLLRKGVTKSCGCYQKEQTSKASIKDVTGQIIGNFKVLRLAREHSDNRTLKWQCQCLLCGNDQVFASVSNLRKQESCGCLHESKGNRKIKQILVDNNIQFIQEKRFNDLKFESGCQARYDFYLPEFNTLIEYDGRQHFVMGNGVYDNLEKITLTQEHDRIKNLYAKEKGIVLIRIPYTHYDLIKIEDLLPTTSSFVIE